MIQVEVGEKLPLSLLFRDGNPGKYPVAHVFFGFAEVAGSPFPLSHLAHGLYRNDFDFQPSSAGTYRAVYVVYDDVARTTTSRYSREEDVFLVTEPLAREASVQEAVTAALAAESSAEDARAAAESAQVGVGNVLTALSSKASLSSVQAVATAVAQIPTNPVLSTDARLSFLDATVSSRASTVLLSQAFGTNFDPATDSLEQISEALAALSPGDATLAKQNEILGRLNSLALQNTLLTVAARLETIPANPVLATDPRLSRLDATVSSRASANDIGEIKGSGFMASRDALAEIRALLAAASLDVRPVLEELQEIKGQGFGDNIDSLKDLNDIAKFERRSIKADTTALLSDGEAF